MFALLGPNVTVLLTMSALWIAIERSPERGSSEAM